MYSRMRSRCPSVNARSSPETLIVRATSEVVSSPLSVPVGAQHHDDHTVGLVPSTSTLATSQRSEAFAEAFDSSARMFACAIPVSVKPSTAGVNQLVRAEAVQSTRVGVRAVDDHPDPRDVHAFCVNRLESVAA